MKAADIVLEALKTDNAVNAMEAVYLDVETDLHAMTQEFRPAAPLCSRCTKPINGTLWMRECEGLAVDTHSMGTVKNV